MGSRAALALAAAVLVGSLAIDVVARAPYAYDLEWTEGGVLAHAWWMSHGRPAGDGIGVAPFVGPGYPAVLAALSEVFGLTPLLGRLVSVVASLLGALALAGAALRLSGDRFLAVGVAVAGLGCWARVGCVFDLVRPEALAFALIAVSIAGALGGARSLSALALAAAACVDARAVVWGPALAAGTGALAGGRAALAWTAAFVGGGLAMGSSAGVAGLGEGWWVMPAMSAGDALQALGELGGALPVLCAGAVLAVFALPTDRPAVDVGLPMLGGVGLGWLTQDGSDAGTPLAWLGVTALGAGVVRGGIECTRGALDGERVLLAGIGVSGLLVACVSRSVGAGALVGAVQAMALGSVLGLRSLPAGRSWWGPAVVAAQLLVSAWTTPHRALRPTDADVEAGDRLVAVVRGLPGPVWSPHAAWIPVLAGHEPRAHALGLERRGMLDPGAGTFRAVVVAEGPWAERLEASTRERTRLHHAGGALAPKSGPAVHLISVRVPR